MGRFLVVLGSLFLFAAPAGAQTCTSSSRGDDELGSFVDWLDQVGAKSDDLVPLDASHEFVCACTCYVDDSAKSGVIASERMTFDVPAGGKCEKLNGEKCGAFPSDPPLTMKLTGCKKTVQPKRKNRDKDER